MKFLEHSGDGIPREGWTYVPNFSHFWRLCAAGDHPSGVDRSTNQKKVMMKLPIGKLAGDGGWTKSRLEKRLQPLGVKPRTSIKGGLPDSFRWFKDSSLNSFAMPGEAVRGKSRVKESELRRRKKVELTSRRRSKKKNTSAVALEPTKALNKAEDERSTRIFGVGPPIVFGDYDD
jgi:hypothetical protein